MQFGHSGSSLHTLDLYSASVLQATLLPGYSPSQEFRSLMQELAVSSCDAYRAHVHFSEDFVKYALPTFRQSFLYICIRKEC